MTRGGRGNETVIVSGAFVAALEYASSKTAKVIGKPSLEFFNITLSSFTSEGNSFHPSEVGMVR
jgi:ribonucleotide monophosphatase NagD (HAD superfamily)